MPAQPEPFAVAFGAGVRRARLARGLSQRDLATAVQVPRTYVVDLEHGRRNPTLRNIVRFAVALDVSVSELMVEIDQAPRSSR